MITASITSKGQITIPAAVREALHVSTGDRVEFVEIAPGRYELIAVTRPISALKGMFGRPARPGIGRADECRDRRSRYLCTMTGLDTNVLVRYIMQDDAAQAAKASALMDSLTVQTPGFIALVSMVELVWVLGACYGLGRAQLIEALVRRTRELVVERADIVWRAVRIYCHSSADFAYCLITCCPVSAGCNHTMTFDHAAAKHAGMRLML